MRAATPFDLQGILETMRLSLGETPLLRRTPDLWRWKHVENPFGESIVLVAVSGEGTIAGVRAFMRWDLEVGPDQTIRCLRPVDTATHPEFQRRGIFRSLTMSAIEVARQEGVDLIFNTPNEKSAPGYLEMGWERVSWIGVQIRPRLGRAFAPDPESRPRIEHLLPEAETPALINLPSKGSGSFMRTPQGPTYLQWRFARHPYASYGWVPGQDDNGLMVRASSRNGRSELVVSDILGPLDHLPFRETARRSRARYMAGWFSPGSPKRVAASRGGLLPVPGVRTLQLVALPLTDFPIDPFDLGSWNLSTSDLELL